MYNFRTDLAVERNDIYKHQNNLQNDADGIEVENEEKEDIKISRVKVLNENGEKAIGKPIGNYITLDIKNMKSIDDDTVDKISEVLATELK